MANPLNIFKGLFSGRRSKKRTASYDLKSQSLAMALGLNGNVSITEKSVLSFAAFYACVMAIAEDVSMMPWDVYQRKQNGRFKAFKHPNYHLLKDSPHPNYTSKTFRLDLIVHLLVWGNGYAKINRKPNGRIDNLEIIHPGKVDPFKADDGLIYYKMIGTSEIITANDMIHVRNFSFDGVKGVSVMSLHADTLRSGLSANKITKTYYENGLHGGTVIELPEGVTIKDDVEHKRIRDGFKEKYSGPGNVGEPIIMPNGAKYRQIEMPIKDAELLATREFTVEEICRIFSVTTERIQQHKNSTNSNIEKQAQEYVTYGLQPRVTNIEQEVNRKAFTTKEKGTFYNKIEMKSLLRGNIKDHTEYLKFMRFYGLMNANEIRALEDMNPVTDGTGDIYLAQSSMAPVDLLRAFYESQTKKDEFQQ